MRLRTAGWRWGRKGCLWDEGRPSGGGGDRVRASKRAIIVECGERRWEAVGFALRGGVFAEGRRLLLRLLLVLLLLLWLLRLLLVVVLRLLLLLLR